MNVDWIKWIYFCVNEFEVGVKDSIFSGNERQKVWNSTHALHTYFALAWIPLTIDIFIVGGQNCALFLPGVKRALFKLWSILVLLWCNYHLRPSTFHFDRMSASPYHISSLLDKVSPKGLYFVRIAWTLARLLLKNVWEILEISSPVEQMVCTRGLTCRFCKNKEVPSEDTFDALLNNVCFASLLIIWKQSHLLLFNDFVYFTLLSQ